jgi:nitrogen fixation NifU-like protein
MTDDVRDLYQEIILDHNRSPRNFHPMPEADATREGYNPLCGDRYTFYLKFDGDRIADISFEGSGCAISKASASVMSTILKGRSREDADRLFHLFHGIVTGTEDAETHRAELGKLAAFAGVSEFPIRVKCATLPWHTMHGALEGRAGTASTESPNGDVPDTGGASGKERP